VSHPGQRSGDVGRFEDGPGSNPEQLIAAAHASCFSMALSNMLAKAGPPPDWCLPLVPASHELATNMVCDPRVAFFSFIGSAKIATQKPAPAPSA